MTAEVDLTTLTTAELVNMLREGIDALVRRAAVAEEAPEAE